MKSVFDFIVTPEGNRYSNEVDIDGDKLIVNSSIENFKLINRKATVLISPLLLQLKVLDHLQLQPLYNYRLQG